MIDSSEKLIFLKERTKRKVKELVGMMKGLRWQVQEQKASFELRSAYPKQRSEVEAGGIKQKKIQIIPLNLYVDLLFRISEAKLETSLLLPPISLIRSYFVQGVKNWKNYQLGDIVLM